MSEPAQLSRSITVAGQGKLPLVRQAEAAECGLACLTMVARYYGHDTDIRTLRSRYPQSIQGATLRTLMDVATELQLTTRALRFELGAIAELQLPCLLHWNMNHFVVLKALRRGRAIIHDPAQGIITCDQKTLDASATGVALELTPFTDFNPLSESTQLRLTQLWTAAQGLPLSLALIAGLSLLLQATVLLSPLYLQFVVDEVIARHDKALLTILAAGFALLLLFEVVTRSVRQFAVLRLSNQLNLQLGTNVVSHLIRLPLDYFQLRHLGDIVSRYASINAIRQLFTEGLVSIVVDGLLSLTVLVAMFIYSPRLTLLVLAVTALYLAVRALLYTPMRRKTTDIITADARTQSSLMESIRGIAAIKLHRREGERLEQWQNQLVRTMRAEIGLRKLDISAEAINTLLFGGANLAIVFLAAHSVMSGLMSIGMLFAFMSFSQRFIQGTQSLIDQFFAFRMLDVHLERLADIVLTPKETTNEDTLPGVSRTPGNKPGELSIDNLAFSYPGGAIPVFADVGFTLSPGECVAITGPSGCGKSTLLYCLAGLLQPTQGSIRWNKRSIYGSRAYRDAIACVMQDDQLFSGSIADNITFFATQPAMDRVVHAAELACIHQDIVQMPMQYNTLIGEMGSALSGGQRQRICIARALYRQPAILLMDEATSHLDPECEASVSANIARLTVSRILVAHRMETIRTADRRIELIPLDTDAQRLCNTAQGRALNPERRST